MRAIRRAIGIGLVAAAAAIISAQIAIAATSTATVTPSTAQPGDEITVAIHVFGGGFWGTDLYVFPSSAQADGPHCGALPGAILVGTVSWRHDVLNHDAVGQFTLPDVPDGGYALGLELGNVIPPCFPAGSFIVSVGQAPDTAMERSPMPPRWWAITTGILLIAAATWLWRRPTLTETRTPDSAKNQES
jgi:hypothetical protein